MTSLTRTVLLTLACVASASVHPASVMGQVAGSTLVGSSIPSGSGSPTAVC